LYPDYLAAALMCIFSITCCPPEPNENTLFVSRNYFLEEERSGKIWKFFIVLLHSNCSQQRAAEERLGLESSKN
jgi:hypothetical protein